MLMNDNHFDRYYCINSAQTKEIMVHYILKPQHKSFHFILDSGFSFSLLARALSGSR